MHQNSLKNLYIESHSWKNHRTCSIKTFFYDPHEPMDRPSIYRIYSNTIRILIKPAPPIEPAVVLSKFPIKPAANLCFHEIEPADCNRINTVVSLGLRFSFSS